MNTSNISKYAPKARTDFIDAVTRQANRLGLYKDQIVSASPTGGLLQIEGNTFEASVQPLRNRLIEKIKAKGFEQFTEQVAYTWFNRLCAIRYMELHDYLGHGLRVLSPRSDESWESGAVAEILDQAQEAAVVLELDRNQIIELKLANKEEELYRLLLLAQCHQLHKAMPFLFEPIDASDELLLPDGLTRTDSLTRQLVGAIPQEEWSNIEIIGWLYQFYISQKKDEVIGKVVKSEDIPAATQLFTPNWIVKYMVQNSLGAQWLATYPQSPLKGQMEYYIEPAEQTDEVNAQLAAITPSQLNPEELTLIDPASGSGHILVEAYELFKAIYLERGYRQRDVPQLILTQNLFGLDIDERAAQLTGFALMMKGRADDRRLFERGVKLNVMALVDSAGFDAEALAKGVELSDYGLKPGDLTELKNLFEHATTFGSLIQVPEALATKLPVLKQLSETTSQDLFVADALKRLGPLVQQADLLAAQYDAVVANPPYVARKYQEAILKKYLNDKFSGYDKDLFSAFIDRDLTFSKPNGRLGFMSPQVWMFLSSFEELRTKLFDRSTITSLIQPEYNAFWDSAHVSICSYVMQNKYVAGYSGAFIRLTDFYGAEVQPQKTLEAIKSPSCGWLYRATTDNFAAIPGHPVAYWVSDRFRRVFEEGVELGSLAEAAVGLQTGDNNQFVRYWYEVSQSKIGHSMRSRDEATRSSKKWFPYNKGGYYRRWYGNQELLVNWEDDGREVRAFGIEENGRPRSRPQNAEYYFRPSLSWSLITSGPPSFRSYQEGFIHDVAGMSAFQKEAIPLDILLGYCNTPITTHATRVLNPTVNLQAGNFASLPFLSTEIEDIRDNVPGLVGGLVCLASRDWNAYERSWDFQSLPLLTASSEPTPTLESSYTAWITQNRDTIAEMKRLEEENNRLFIDAYGLADELTPDVPIEQITLTVNPAYRYGGRLSEEEQWTRFRQDTMEELVSYAIGCMMGRYSLDAPGLIYAQSSNEGFDSSQYLTFPADDDGIVPLTDTEWFDDDAAQRLVEFISVAWDRAHLEENLSFLAENLSPKRNETSRDTIRRYLCTKFFKDHHLKGYKKRPIYWLFSSGKQKAFEALVYLHRYNRGTLARMRTEYVTPLLGKFAAQLDQLTTQINSASSTAEATRLKREQTKLEKKQTELQAYDDKLKHYADMQIELDLDDGVKVNYGKFGDLLAEVKAVTGKKPE